MGEELSFRVGDAHFKKCKLETVMPAQDVGMLHLQIPNQEWDSVLGFKQTKTVGGLL